MKYKGYVIQPDLTGFAPKWATFYFYIEGDDIFAGSGDSIENCKKQIDEIIEDRNT